MHPFKVGDRYKCTITSANSFNGKCLVCAGHIVDSVGTNETSHLWVSSVKHIYGVYCEYIKKVNKPTVILGA